MTGIIMLLIILNQEISRDWPLVQIRIPPGYKIGLQRLLLVVVESGAVRIDDCRSSKSASR
jgi:hypothetical protein